MAKLNSHDTKRGACPTIAAVKASRLTPVPRSGSLRSRTSNVMAMAKTPSLMALTRPESNWDCLIGQFSLVIDLPALSSSLASRISLVRISFQPAASNGVRTGGLDDSEGSGTSLG